MGGSAVLLGLIFFLTRSRKQKKKTPAAASEPKALLATESPEPEVKPIAPVQGAYTAGLQPSSVLQRTMILSATEPTLRVVVDGSDKEFVLREMVTSIGRNANNHIVINNSTVSSFHAEVTEEGGRWYIQDKGSTNGVLVDGALVAKGEIKNGSLIQLGSANLQFTI